MISDVLTAMNIVRDFNRLSVHEVASMLKNEYGFEVRKEDVDDWAFMGLNNTDFLEIYYLSEINVEVIQYVVNGK